MQVLSRVAGQDDDFGACVYAVPDKGSQRVVDVSLGEKGLIAYWPWQHLSEDGCVNHTCAAVQMQSKV